MITIHAHSKIRKVTKGELKRALHMLHIELPYMREVNLTIQRRSCGQWHLHTIVHHPSGIFFRPFTKYMRLQIRWDCLNTQQDVHRAQLYVANHEWRAAGLQCNSRKALPPFWDCLKAIKKRRSGGLQPPEALGRMSYQQLLKMNAI